MLFSVKINRPIADSRATKRNTGRIFGINILFDSSKQKFTNKFANHQSTFKSTVGTGKILLLKKISIS
jgi:hypothetical protein